MPEPSANLPTAAEVAASLAARLEEQNCDYALGGAVALGCWTEPRGTVDVDVSLYLPIDDPSRTTWTLTKVGAEFSEAPARQSLTEHGFCRVQFMGRRLNVFLPISPFYEAARARRRRMPIGNQDVLVRDAETLCAFKMMFFRRKDLADVEAVLRTQGSGLDRGWVETQLTNMFGPRDPRLSEWRDILRDVDA